MFDVIGMLKAVVKAAAIAVVVAFLLGAMVALAVL